MVSAMESSTFTEIKTRALQEPWKSAGVITSFRSNLTLIQEDMIEEVATWIKENKVKKQADIKKQFQDKFMGWMLKLSAGDRYLNSLLISVYVSVLELEINFQRASIYQN